MRRARRCSKSTSPAANRWSPAISSAKARSASPGVRLFRGRRFRGRLQRDVLDAPVLRLAGVQLVLADAVHLVHPVELPDLLAERPEPAEQMPFEIFLVDLAAGVGAEEEL